MQARWDTLQSGGSSMRTYTGLPGQKGPCPAVIVIQHAFGVDETMQDIVHRLAREGYLVAAPDLYHRQPADGSTSLERMARLRDDEVLADIAASILHLKSCGIPMSNFGVTGFCMGGRVTYLAATSIPELKAAAVFYGGNIMKSWGDGPTPFERSANIQCPVIGFFGADDGNPTVEDVRKIDAELTRLGKWHEFHIYNDTGHAFHNFQNIERYRERAARSSWHSLLAFFTQYLKRQ